jgi:hypothetical protein
LAENFCCSFGISDEAAYSISPLLQPLHNSLPDAAGGTGYQYQFGLVFFSVAAASKELLQPANAANEGNDAEISQGFEKPAGIPLGGIFFSHSRFL